MDVDAVVWVCPRCGSYYASSNAPDLANTPQPGLNGGETGFKRSICPNMTCFNMGIDRRAHTVRIRIGEAA